MRKHIWQHRIGEAILKKGNRALRLDGRERTKQNEYDINEAFAATFRDRSGDLVLDYLKSITINAVSGPEITDHALRHLEGMRFLFGIISARTEAGNEQKKMALKKEKTNE